MIKATFTEYFLLGLGIVLILFIVMPRPNLGANDIEVPPKQRCLNDSLTIRGKERCATTSSEWATLKGMEISKVGSLQKITRYHYQIEIVTITPIERGVEVLVRAWNKNGAIGFVDGTVEIERIRIFNPPILVPDPQGDIIYEWKNGVTGTTYQRILREDPKEALLQSIEQTIFVMKRKYDASKIIKGKVGNTTSTFYPDASNVDGRALITTAASWTAAVNGNGNFSDYNTTNLQLYTHIGDNRIDRLFALFDTSSIPDTDTISAATLSMYGVSKTTTLLTNNGVNITQANPAANNAIVNADYQATTPFTTLFATVIPYASLVTSAYNDFALNASGIANISKTGTSKFSVRLQGDIADVEPTGVSDQDLVFSGYSTSGTSQDPKLVVEHAAPGGAKFNPYYFWDF